MTEITNSITTDTTPAQNDFSNGLDTLANGVFNSIKGEFGVEDIERIVSNYLSRNEASKIFASLEDKYVIPKDTFRTTYSGLLKSLLQVYINTYSSMAPFLPQDTDDQNMFENLLSNSGNTTIGNNIGTQNSNPFQGLFQENAGAMLNSLGQGANAGTNNSNEQNKMVAVVNENIAKSVISGFTTSAAIVQTENTMARVMTETVMKRDILSKVGELTANLTNSFATAFNIDQDKVSDAFQLKMTEEEITRIVTAMMSGTEASAKTNLVSLGYQNKEEPTYISFYFNSFEGKENFIDFIDSYNEEMEAQGEDDKVINYTDTTGILMDSVKTIVNAVTYVLIAFISISLVVSSIMIGIITYISVYERTKEIGILRAIGASKQNISSIFNAETFIIGLLSGLFGIGVSYALIPIINAVLRYFTGNIPLNVMLYFDNAVVLVVLSIILTLIGGLIPARAASKKDPVIALRTE